MQRAQKISTVIGLLMVVVMTSPLSAQESNWEVTTFTTARANGDIYVADNGEVFISDFGPPSLGNGSTVVKINTEGEVSLFASGLSGAPSGIVMAPDGTLYVATLNGGHVYSIDPNGNKSIIYAGLSGPVGLTLDDNNNLYVAECSANRISRLANGATEVIATFPGNSCPNGLVWGHDNALYLLMWANGNIFRVGLDGTSSFFATVPGGGGHLELSGDHYYVLARTAHQLYRVDFNGGVELYAGTGVDGNTDGPVAEATLSRPNGIGVHQPTGVLYITGSSNFSLNDIPIRKIAPPMTDAGPEFLINPGLAGSWFEPSSDGQGVVLDFAVTADRFDVVLYWFTYDDQPATGDDSLGFGSTQNRWFTAIGPAAEDRAELQIFRTSGGVFDDPAAVSSEAVGTATLLFTSCFDAVLDYRFTTPDELSGSLDLQRITPDIWCEILDQE